MSLKLPNMAISDIKVTKTSIKYTGASSTRRYGVPADAISVPADSAAAVVKFAISIRRESCTNAKAKYSSSVVPPDPSVHFYHWARRNVFVSGEGSTNLYEPYTIL